MNKRAEKWNKYHFSALFLCKKTVYRKKELKIYFLIQM